jgi:hypothetical protein
MWLAREIEHAACGRFDGDVVGATFAFDIELFNLERLRLPMLGAATLVARGSRSRSGRFASILLPRR